MPQRYENLRFGWSNRRATRARAALLLLSACILLAPSALALITGGGDNPVHGGNWPAGSLALANSPHRSSFWEGPPFGGGDSHFNYSGEDAAAFQADLDLFAKIDSPRRELLVYDATTTATFGNSFGLDASKRTLWEFEIWDSAAFYRLNRPDDAQPGRMFLAGPLFGRPLPPPRLSVFVGEGSPVDMSAVRVPEGVTLLDRRVDASPWSDSKGGVVQVAVRDIATSAPLPAATVEVGHYNQNTLVPDASAISAANGEAVIRDLRAGSLFVRVSCAGYATRIVGSFQNYGRTLGVFSPVSLSPAAELAGRVVDAAGTPLAGAEVRVMGLLATDGTGYEQNPFNQETKFTTRADGRFEFTGLPQGKIALHAVKAGFLNAALDAHPVPGPEVTLVMTSGSIISGRVLGIGPLAEDQRVAVAVKDSNRPDDAPDSHYACEPDGTFEIGSLKAGEYTLHAVVEKVLAVGAYQFNGADDAHPSRKVVLKDGQSLQVDLQFNPAD